MHINVNHPLLHRIVDELVDQGWSHQSIFMPERLTTRLAEECRTRAVAGDLTPAAIGRGDGQVIREASAATSRNGWSPENPRPATNTWG